MGAPGRVYARPVQRKFPGEWAVIYSQVSRINRRHVRSLAHARYRGGLLQKLGLVLLLSLSSLGSAHAADEGKPLTREELRKTHWTIEADWLLYCRNHRLGEARQNIRRAVVAIHGKQRNAK